MNNLIIISFFDNQLSIVGHGFPASLFLCFQWKICTLMVIKKSR
ncbi:hypothetical protein XIS1_600119 [Xenorhabdus innexi]|uniref:Uncharacterized protein n=1 Tax=Xenorhabdus innexi TaxID=290109 RepID=A0A1N6MZQ9_9GAMM|nr:hypothetical protein XIS1_600119 [Xenorhabdus innexi]